MNLRLYYKARDYYEIPRVADGLMPGKWEYEELGFDEDHEAYIGLIWKGKKPSKQTIAKDLEAHDIELWKAEKERKNV